MKSLAIVRILVVTVALAALAAGNPDSLRAQTPVKGAPTASSVAGQTKSIAPLAKPVESKSATNPFEMLLPSLHRSFFDLFSW